MELENSRELSLGRELPTFTLYSNDNEGAQNHFWRNLTRNRHHKIVMEAKIQTL